MTIQSVHASKLIIENLNKRYFTPASEVVALKDIDLTIGAGEFVAIVGASGCGKSTLLRIIAGLENGFQGSIRLGYAPVAGPGLDRGMVFQEHRLIRWLTVEKNVAFGLNGRENGEKERIVREHLELVGLAGFARAYPHQLSGGIQMQQEILRIWEVERTTMVLVTHDIDEAIYLGDRVVVMSNRPGTVKKVLPVDLPRPRDRSSYEFVQIRKEIFAEFFAAAERPFAYAI